MDVMKNKQFIGSTICFIQAFLDAVVAATNTTATTPNESQQYHVKEKEKSFPVWLIGVIILSSIALIVIVATIVQRILRRRADRHEQYRMAS